MKNIRVVSAERDRTEKIFSLVCSTALVISAVLGICMGSVKIPLSDFISALFFDENTVNSQIIYSVRMPRVAASVLAGIALAVSGVIIQSVLENPLAAPSIIGVNSGAGFFAVLAMAIFPYKISVIPAAAFLGAIITVMTVYFIAVKNGASKMTLVLAGVAVSNLLNSGIDTITTFFPDSLNGITSFKIGGVMGMTFSKLYPACIYIAVGFILAMLLSHELDILSLGDRTAKSLGMNVKVIRFILLLSAALLAGAAVSFAGLLRHFIKSGNMRLIPGTALLGAVFVTLCDLISRTVFAPYEVQLGIIISYIGVPFFIYLIMKKKGGKHGDRT